MTDNISFSLKLRPLNSEEIILIKHLWIELYREQKESNPSLRLDPYGFSAWKDSIENIVGRFGFIIAAVVNSYPAGFVAGRIKIPTPPFRSEPVGFISELFVISDQRGKGLGKMLLRAAEEWFTDNDVNFMELQVLTRNSAAKAFYSNQGWLSTVEHMEKSIQRP